MEIKIRCAPLPHSRCKFVEELLNKKFGNDNVKNNGGRFEHIVKAKFDSYTDADKHLNQLRLDSKGEISLIQCNVINN